MYQKGNTLRPIFRRGPSRPGLDAACRQSASLLSYIGVPWHSAAMTSMAPVTPPADHALQSKWRTVFQLSTFSTSQAGRA